MFVRAESPGVALKGDVTALGGPVWAQGEVKQSPSRDLQNQTLKPANLQVPLTFLQLK